MELNCTPWFEKIVNFNGLELPGMLLIIYFESCLKLLGMPFKLSTMVGETFKFYLFDIARNAFKSSNMVGKFFAFYLYKISRNACKLSTMVGENCEFCLSQIARNVFKLSTMVGEIFEFYVSEIARNAFKLSIMIRENFEFYLSEIVENAFKLSTMDGENFEYFCQIARNALNCPTWLEKILYFEVVIMMPRDESWETSFHREEFNPGEEKWYLCY